MSVYWTAEHKVGRYVSEGDQPIGQGFQIGHRCCDDFEQEAVLAGEMVRFEHVGRPAEELGRGVSAHDACLSSLVVGSATGAVALDGLRRRASSSS